MALPPISMKDFHGGIPLIGKQPQSQGGAVPLVPDAVPKDHVYVLNLHDNEMFIEGLVVDGMLFPAMEVNGLMAIIPDCYCEVVGKVVRYRMLHLFSTPFTLRAVPAPKWWSKRKE